MPQKQTIKPHHLHVLRIVLFALLILALFLTKSVAANSQQVTKQSAVLAYATNMGIGGLLSATNSYRAANGLPALQLDSQLNTSAQNKAQHMIDNNYWAHVSPDGTQPWYFFTQAGYAYSAAGENLAYGFDSSQAVVDAWMNSPSHRANVLGSYNDVGFGIASGASYQGNPNTVVVAHYGTRRTQPAPPPAPAPTTPAPSTPTPASTPSAAPATPAPSSPTEPVPPANTPTPEQPAPEDAAQQPKESPAPVKPADTPEVAVATTKNISLMESLHDRQAPLLAVVGVGIAVAATGGFAMTHRRLFKHALATGENFVIHHPIFDFSTVAIITVLILTTTMSRIG